jgi:hypothetical protein
MRRHYIVAAGPNELPARRLGSPPEQLPKKGPNRSPIDGDAHVSASSIFAKRVVRIAVQPTLARLCGSDHRVPASVRVFAGMAIWRAVAAERHAARLAGAQVDPA